jgi:hypothetical protein
MTVDVDVAVAACMQHNKNNNAKIKKETKMHRSKQPRTPAPPVEMGFLCYCTLLAIF